MVTGFKKQATGYFIKGRKLISFCFVYLFYLIYNLLLFYFLYSNTSKVVETIFTTSYNNNCAIYSVFEGIVWLTA
jgi:hypothetical protein